MTDDLANYDTAVLESFSNDTAILVDSGIRSDIAEKFAELFQFGSLTFQDLDERAITSIKSLKLNDALDVIGQIRNRDMAHVSNKSAFLCGIMKATHQKQIMEPVSIPASNEQDKHNDSAIEAILDRTGYTLDVTTGQRKYGGPPPESATKVTRPGKGTELFCGKIPIDVYEDELIPLFEPYGTLWEIRLMMDPVSTKSRGFAFITFCNTECASKAAIAVDNHEIRQGKKLKVNISEGNCRLFVGNIPKTKSKDNIFEEFEKVAEGLSEVIVYPHADNPNILNRGFAFLDFDSHKTASLAKKKLGGGRTPVFGCNLIVEWAEAQEEPSNAAMSKVRVLYIKNVDHSVTEEMMKEKFNEFGEIERVKVIKDFAFVHFINRDDCVKALVMNKQDLCGKLLDVSLAKPLNDMKRASVNGNNHYGGGGGGRGAYDNYGGNHYSPRRGGGGGGGYNNGGRWNQEERSEYPPRRSFQKSIDYGHGNSSSDHGQRDYSSPRSYGNRENYRGSRDQNTRNQGSRGSYGGGGGSGGRRDSGRGRRSGDGGHRGGGGGSQRGSGFKRRNESSSWEDRSKKRNTSFDNGDQSFQTDDYSGSQW